VDQKQLKLLRSKSNEASLANLLALDNPKLHAFVAEAVELCNPASVFVCTDSPEDIAYIRRLALETGAEKPLAIEGHTYHFDGYYDQGRDKDSTRYLLPRGKHLGAKLNTIDKDQGLAEVKDYLKNSMAGRIMLVRFFCLGPVGSRFSISGVQLTDSAYVAHSEDLLYRSGYAQFKRLGKSPDFFRVLHSSGRLEENISIDWPKRRVYIDIEENEVYSVNTQYAGNTVGFKKLSLRLAICKADREGWLAEHMFLMGIHGPNGRVTYFAGAYPSYCGKTSTAMIPGETIVGDDLAYLRKIAGAVHAVNVESGIFGVIRNVTADDDPEIWKVLASPGEVIFSNVLVADGVPYWLGDGRETPERGVNHSGPWYTGKTDADGNEIPCAHPNARYTFALHNLANLDPRAEDPDGVPVGAIIYGGRDSDTLVPVQEAFDWPHGVVTMGASLESETTAATLGTAGVRSFQPMSNLDFVSLPLGRYVSNHLAFADGLASVPRIFAANYFLKTSNGKYLNGMKDKYVWTKWMELRVNGDVGCLKTPTGCIPDYEDLKRLFKQVLSLDYARGRYEEQFKLRIPEWLAKIRRIEHIYRNEVADAPKTLFDVLGAQQKRLEDARRRFGDYVSPSKFE